MDVSGNGVSAAFGRFEERGAASARFPLGACSLSRYPDGQIPVMSPPNLEAQADDPVEWTENQRPKAIYRWLLWESALVALNVFMAWRNFLDGDIETVIFV